jgi:hypothetical protein
MFFFLEETYGVVLLEHKVKRLRKETGNENLRTAGDHGLPPKELLKRSIFRPLKMLFFSPIVLLLSLYMAFVYGLLYLLFTTITSVFISDYGFSQGLSGLSYLGIGIGMMIGLVVFGILSDKMLKKLSGGGPFKPEYRLPLMIPAALITPIGMFIYGWSAQYHVHWFVPILGTGFVGVGLIGGFVSYIIVRRPVKITKYSLDAHLGLFG